MVQSLRVLYDLEGPTVDRHQVVFIETGDSDRMCLQIHYTYTGFDFKSISTKYLQFNLYSQHTAFCKIVNTEP